jgi:hypothetical protein
MYFRGRFPTKARLAARIFISGLLCCLAALSPTDANTSDRRNLENDLRNIYEHKLLSLRQPCFGSKLKSDSSGTLVGKAVGGPWSTSGLLQVEKPVLTSERFD